MKRPIPAEAFEHGDYRRYNRGCRCRPCTDGANAYNRRGKYLRATGRGAIVNPQRAAARIHRLRAAGMQDAAIQAAADICPDVFYRILRGASDIHRTAENRILAVPIPATGQSRNGAHVPALGTIRRLRALAADGWPAAELGRRSGREKAYILYLQAAPSDLVRLWVAVDIRNLYEELHGKRPEDHGVLPHIARAARERAASRDWAGTAYWDDDDFDNPDFIPAVADTPRYIAVGENALELEAQGYTREQIAARLCINRNTLEKHLSRYRASLAQAKEAA